MSKDERHMLSSWSPSYRRRALLALVGVLALASLGASAAWAAGIDCPNRDDGSCVGTPEKDSLLGTKEADEMYALAGNDFLPGLAGNDVMYGGPDRDSIEGNAGLDRLHGGEGDDYSLQGGPGNDYTRGGPGNDNIDSEIGVDEVYANRGDDDISIIDEDIFDERPNFADCGPGRDKIFRDDADRIRNCEIINP